MKGFFKPMNDIISTNTTENEIAAATKTITGQAEQTDTEQTTNTETITEPSEKPVITCIDDLKTIAENSVLGVLDGYIWEYCEDKNNHSEELKAFLNGNDMQKLAYSQSKVTEYRKRVKKISYLIVNTLFRKKLQQKAEERGEQPPFIITYTNEEGEIVKEKVLPTALAQYIQQTDDYVLVHGKSKSLFYAYNTQTGIYTAYNDNQVDGFIKRHIEGYNPHLVKTKDVMETKKLILSDLDLKVIEPNKFNSNEKIIVGVDGVLDINSGKHFAHSPTFFSTIQLPCNVFIKPKDRGTAPTFEKYLDDLTVGYQDRKDFLLEVLAAILSNEDCAKFKKCLFLFGAGDSGKSQFLKLARMLVGENNSCIVDLYTLVENEFAKAGLMNKRLTGYGDINFKRLKNTSLDLLKTIVGGDPIDGDVKFGDRVTFTFKGMAVYGANKMPVVSDERKQEIYNRMIILPCNNVIPKEKQDGKLCEKMFAERDEIMKILYPYFKKILNNNHFSEPQICIDTKKEYIETSNPVIVFINECCEKRLGKVQSGDMCTTGRMYDVFKEWYRQNYDKYDIPSQRKFKKEICNYLNVEYDKCETRTMDGRYYPLTLTRESRIEFKIQYGNDGSSFNPKNFNTAISDKKE